MKLNKDVNFSIIDIDSWERKEYFEHYYKNVRCTYSVATNIDITGIYKHTKEHNLRLYPTLIWWIANAVNHFEFLRFNYDEFGNVGYYDMVNPSFTYMPPESDRFNVLWCKYNQCFQDFYLNCVEVMGNFDTSRMFPMDDMPKNCFDISSIPWIEFTSFNLNVYTDGTHLAPIFSTGKLIKDKGKIKIPVSLQVHHSVCDGYHVGQCFDYLQKIADEVNEWI